MPVPHRKIARMQRRFSRGRPSPVNRPTKASAAWAKPSTAYEKKMKNSYRIVFMTKVVLP